MPTRESAKTRRFAGEDRARGSRTTEHECTRQLSADLAPVLESSIGERTRPGENPSSAAAVQVGLGVRLADRRRSSPHDDGREGPVGELADDRRRRTAATTW